MFAQQELMLRINSIYATFIHFVLTTYVHLQATPRLQKQHSCPLLVARVDNPSPNLTGKIKQP